MCNQIIQTVLINPLFFCDWDLPLWWTYWGWTDSLFIWSTEIGQPAPPTSEVQPGGTGDEVQPIPGQASLVDLHRFPCTPWAKSVPVHWLYMSCWIFTSLILQSLPVSLDTCPFGGYILGTVPTLWSTEYMYSGTSLK